VTVTYPIIALADGEPSDPQWFADVTEAVNDHETRVGVLEQQQIQLVYKTVDESVSSATTGTTLQNDDDLFVTAEPNSQYDFRLWMVINTGTTPDFKFGWTAPSGSTLSWSVQEGNTIVIAAVLQGPFSLASVVPINGAASDQMIIVEGLLTTGVTGGTFRLQWAQNTANASLTYVKATSRLRLWKLV
jgi:hypothetical protein